MQVMSAVTAPSAKLGKQTMLNVSHHRFITAHKNIFFARGAESIVDVFFWRREAKWLPSSGAKRKPQIARFFVCVDIIYDFNITLHFSF